MKRQCNGLVYVYMSIVAMVVALLSVSLYVKAIQVVLCEESVREICKSCVIKIDKVF